MKMVNQILSFFDLKNPHFKGNFSSKKVDYFYLIIFLLTPIGIGVAVNYYFVLDAPKTATVVLIHVFLAWLVPVLRKLKISEDLHIHFGVLIYATLFTATTALTGNVQSMDFLWLATIPVLAGNFLSRKETLLWSLYSIVSIISFGIGAEYLESLNEINPESRFLHSIISAISMAIALTVITVLSETAKLKLKLINEHSLQAANHSSNLASLGEMAGGIGHEINNPLMIIYGSSLALERLIDIDEEKSEKILKHINNIKQTTKRASKIVRGLKTLAREAHHEEFEIVTLREIIDEIEGILKSRFMQQNIKLIINKEHSILDKKIKLLRVQFSQALINLISNSFDAVEELDTRWVILSFNVEEQNIIISVTDSGLGIPKKYVDNIFTPFFTTKPVGKGTGLGLSLCYTIIKKCHGDLIYDSSKRNTTFKISLPLDKIEARNYEDKNAS